MAYGHERPAATSAFSRLKAVACALVAVGGVLIFGAVHGQGIASGPPLASLAQPEAGYAGSGACAACHQSETSAWQGSMHARAMQVATAQTILGDFENARAEHFGSRARFFKENGRYLVETEGKDGKPATFAVDFTFGLEPLQQYLTSFPDGRIQALPYAWDTRPREQGGQRWFHLYPDEAIPPGDALHWTGGQQNWNFMCADCHSTAVRKGYDEATNRYATSFSEITAGCESCHGKASGHVRWATNGQPAGVAHHGFASVAAKRPQPDWSPDPVSGSPAHGVTRPVGDEVETCGTCHARRGQFAEGWQPGKPLADFYRPAFLTPGLFEADGQMRDEVFNYTSFQQSRMYAKGVVCSDCHDPHSSKLKAAKAEVCAQCHAPEKFSITHTRHAQGPTAPDCISCHMPVRTYMVVDQRHDHGFRVPRPDQSVALGAPNACNDCHRDKDAGWAATAVETWHGPARKGFQTYARAFHAAATDRPEARDLLMQEATRAETPAIARASALLMLQGRSSIKVDAVLRDALNDPDPMVRIAALEGHEGQPADQRWRRASPLLADPVRAVRMQAANLLADGPPADAGSFEKAAFAAAVAEYIAAETYNSDRPEGRANLARFYRKQGRLADAERAYLAALDLDFAIGPRIDLADLYRSMDREADGIRLLHDTIARAPDAAAPQHSLGLVLVRAKLYDQALPFLRRAAELDSTQPRYAYVYAIALISRGETERAQAVLDKAIAVSPSNVQLLSALLQIAMSARDFARALPLAEKLSMLQPDDAPAARLADQLRGATRVSR